MAMNNSVSNPYFSAKKLDTLDHGNARTWLGETTHHSAGIKGDGLLVSYIILSMAMLAMSVFFSLTITQRRNILNVLRGFAAMMKKRHRFSLQSITTLMIYRQLLRL